MKYLFTLSIVILLLCCSCEKKSQLSEGKVEDLSLIGAEFEITNFESGSIAIKGNLYDKETYAVDNDSIKIKVNNVDLYLGKIPGMGLNDYEYRSFDRIPIIDNYNFEIVLTNGKKYFLGNVKSLAKINKNEVVCNEEGNLNKESIITWKNLEEYNELEVYKSYRSIKTDSANTYRSSDARDTIRIKANGKYTIPITEFSKNNVLIDFIVFYFRAEKKGKMNSELLTGSEIIIKEEIEKQINFKRE